MDNECLNCNKSLEDKRVGSLFCSSSCRGEFHRKKTDMAKEHVDEVPNGLSGYAAVQFKKNEEKIVELESKLGLALQKIQDLEAQKVLREAENTVLLNNLKVEAQKLSDQLVKLETEKGTFEAKLKKAKKKIKEGSGLNGLKAFLTDPTVNQLATTFANSRAGGNALNGVGHKWKEETVELASWYDPIPSDSKGLIWDLLTKISQHGPNANAVLSQLIEQLNENSHDGNIRSEAL